MTGYTRILTQDGIYNDLGSTPSVTVCSRVSLRRLVCRTASTFAAWFEVGMYAQVPNICHAFETILGIQTHRIHIMTATGLPVIVKVPVLVALMIAEYLAIIPPNRAPKREDRSKFGADDLLSISADWQAHVGVVSVFIFACQYTQETHPSPRAIGGLLAHPPAGGSIDRLIVGFYEPVFSASLRTYGGLAYRHPTALVHQSALPHRLHTPYSWGRHPANMLRLPRAHVHLSARPTQRTQARHLRPVRRRPAPLLHRLHSGRSRSRAGTPYPGVVRGRVRPAGVVVGEGAHRIRVCCGCVFADCRCKEDGEGGRGSEEGVRGDVGRVGD